MILFLISCREKIKSTKLQPNKYCCITPPPPFPPKNHLIDSNEMYCQYENKKINFNAKIFAFNNLNSEEKKVDNYLLVSSNKFKSDTFYFTLPNQNYKWNCIQLIPFDDEKLYYISYVDIDTSINLFKLELVGYSEDKGLMIFNSIKNN